MAGKDNGREISRREFGVTLGAVAGLAAGSNLLTPAEVSAAPHVNPRIIGANDRVVVASIGVRGQGNALKRGFAKLANVEIKTICDIDENVGQQRVADKALADLASYKPGYEQDLPLRPFERDPGGHHSGVVDDDERIVDFGRKIAERPVRDYPVEGAVVDEQPRRVPPLGRMLRDQLRRQLVVQLG